jgi:hypothetical protein
MTVTINSYADVQNVLGQLVAANQLPIGQAPHGAFYQTLSYQQFIAGNMPGVGGGPDNGGFKIVDVGNAKQSNIILALTGAAGTVFDPNSGSIGPMPQPNPPYNSAVPAQDDVIAALSAWIDNNCPQFAAHAAAPAHARPGRHRAKGGAARRKA